MTINQKQWPSSSRPEKARRQREYMARKRAGLVPMTERCVICEKVFTVRGQGTYCSEHCREEGELNNRKIRLSSAKAKLANKNVLLRQNYGITLDDRNNMIAEQGGKCAICKNDLSEGRHVHVDHDHITEKVRGILCSNCNIGLGNFKDNPTTLFLAIEYLKKHNVIN